MPITHQTGRRLAVVAGLATLALAAAPTVAAYPIAPDGEPLHLKAGETPSLAPDPVLKPIDSGAGPKSTPVNVVPLAEISSSGTDRLTTALMAISALAVLAVAVSAYALGGPRRGSASGELTRERS